MEGLGAHTVWSLGLWALTVKVPGLEDEGFEVELAVFGAWDLGG